MGKDHEFLQLVRGEDTSAIQRLLLKYKASKPKLLGTGRRININAQDGDGMSGLHQAALAGNMAILMLLLDSGAIIDIKDAKGMRPLHYAVWQGRCDTVELLLQWGSSVNEACYDGNTPLHLAVQHGHFDVVNLLMYAHARPTSRNREHKTALDVACELGRTNIAELLLGSNKCSSLLDESPDDVLDNNRTTCLHLAAKNGHVDIIRLLLKHGVDINRSTLRGTCLHEAAYSGKLQVVKLLLESGADVNKPNSYDQTALDIVHKFAGYHTTREMKQMLKEAVNSVQARAIKDYENPTDPRGLDFHEGDIITVLEQNEDGLWRGVIFGDNHTSRSGYFSAAAVVLLDRQADEVSIMQSIMTSPHHLLDIG